MSPKYSISYLKSFNTKAAIAHLFAFAAFAVLAFVFLKPNYKSASLYRIGATAPPPGEDIDSLDYPTKVERLGSINIASWILVFFGLTVVFHTLYATDFFGRGYYTKFLQEGWNPVRWGEYAISAPIMIVIISILTGNRDITSVWASFFVIAALQFCGLIVERETIKPIKDVLQVQVATAIGWILLLAVWIPLLYSIVAVIGDARGYAANVPAWVPLIVVIQFFQYSWFGFIQMKQVKALVKGMPLPDFFSIERSYILLSFASKLALGSFIGYGLLQRQNSPVELI
jgi:Heliorhodopsin